MTRYWYCAIVLGLLTAIAPEARTQGATEPVLYHACYIPLVGVVYRVKEAGLPDACLSTKHVAFSWNQVGPKGDKGDPGAKGDKGDPGTSGGLTGMTCPTGSWLTGFDRNGSALCRNAENELQLIQPTDPLVATWRLAEPIVLSCGDEGYPVRITAIRVNPTDVSGKPNMSLDLFGYAESEFILFGSLPANPNASAPPIEAVIDGVVSRDLTSIMGRYLYSLRVVFTMDWLGYDRVQLRKLLIDGSFSTATKPSRGGMCGSFRSELIALQP